MKNKINYIGIIISLAVFAFSGWLVLSLPDSPRYILYQASSFFIVLGIVIFIASIKGNSLKYLFFKKDFSGQFGTKKGEKLPFSGLNIYKLLVYTIIFAVVVFLLILHAAGKINLAI